MWLGDGPGRLALAGVSQFADFRKFLRSRAGDIAGQSVTRWGSEGEGERGMERERENGGVKGSKGGWEGRIAVNCIKRFDLTMRA